MIRRNEYLDFVKKFQKVGIKIEYDNLLNVYNKIDGDIFKLGKVEIENVVNTFKQTDEVFVVDDYLRLKELGKIDDISGYYVRLQKIDEFTSLTASVTTQPGYSIVRADLKIGTTIYRGERDFRPEVFMDGFRPNPANGQTSNLVDWVSDYKGQFVSTSKSAQSTIDGPFATENGLI